MISEGLCDTEDWSKDAEISPLPSQKYIYIKIENHFLVIFTILLFSFAFTAALVKCLFIVNNYDI